MAPVDPGALVLVTGASGFLGGYIVHALLDAGYRVRITARSEAKIEGVRALFPAHEIEGAVVPDMTTPGAYDVAARGIDAVIHAASPLDGIFAGPPEDYIAPAVAGVENLHAALQGVKRWIQISSIAAIDDACLPGTILAEDLWNDAAVDACRRLGIDADPWDKYGASKTLAERAFWALPASYDRVALNPSLILAPPRGEMNVSVALGLRKWLTPVPEEMLYKPTSSNIVDARDVSHACVLALSAPAAGERLILSAAPLFGNDVVLAAEAVGVQGLTRGNADPAFREALLPMMHRYDGSKAERVLGFKYRSKDDTLRETVAAVATVRK